MWKNARTKWLTIAFCGGVGLIAWASHRATKFRQFQEIDRDSILNMKIAATRLALYADEHGGAFPDDASTVIPKAPEISASWQYTYCGKGLNAFTSPADRIILQENEMHPNADGVVGMYELTVKGEVVWYKSRRQ